MLGATTEPGTTNDDCPSALASRSPRFLLTGADGPHSLVNIVSAPTLSRVESAEINLLAARTRLIAVESWRRIGRWGPCPFAPPFANPADTGEPMAIANTLKTMLGFLSTLVTRYTPLDLSRGSLEGIFNFLPLGDSIFTSGQPTEAQFRLVKDAGINRVINLAPHNAENALVDEESTLRALDIDYTHIPVDFRDPTDEDFAEFSKAMEGIGSERVLVHCAANMRVSAFMFRYRRDVLGEPPEELRRDLHRIWQPAGVWKQFISS